MDIFVGRAQDMTGGGEAQDAKLNEGRGANALAMQVVPDGEGALPIFTSIITKAEYDALVANGAEEI